MVNCLIVDDEMPARNILMNYCGHVPQLSVVAGCGNAIEAKKYLQENSIDILFLDIHMPVLDGLAFLRTIKQPPQIIFTTAYQEHAVTAFDLAACDYLVKPFSFERFFMAVDRAIERTQSKLSERQDVSGRSEAVCFIKADGKIFKLIYNDILFAEAKGNYTSIVTKDKTLMPNISFSDFERMLPADIFIRVHRSYIINKLSIDRIEGNVVFVGKSEIPISQSCKEQVFRAIGL
ncbi:MAG: response regulator transcription factor [Chitinophagaceae bacterium]|nr:response regulator transcription factor [Chitinophagaceae bacterium]